jgi:hypothetical protein
VIHRSRNLLRYLYLCIELERYDCIKCEGHAQEYMGLSDRDNSLITTVFENVFLALSTGEHNEFNLILDISIYSPSDSEHRFKYLAFEPDASIDILD